MAEILDSAGRPIVTSGEQLGRIQVPLHIAAQIGLRNLINATLQLIESKEEAGLPLAELRRAYQIWGVNAAVAERVEARLVREKIVKTDGNTFWMGDVADLRAYVARAKLIESVSA